MRHLLVFALVLLALVPITWIGVIRDRFSPASMFRTKLAQPVRRTRLAAAASRPREILFDENASDEVLATAPSVNEALLFSGALSSGALSPGPSFSGSSAPVSSASVSSSSADPSAPYHPLLDRSLSAGDKAAELAPELVDSIVRIEGIYDPTRIGTLGPAFRMQIRPGTASMTNVFGDRWLRADVDPNVHYKVQTSAEVWLHPLPRGCEGFTRFRPYDGVLTLDAMSPNDCARIARLKKNNSYAVVYQAVAVAPASVPIFAAPYAGGRFTLPQLRAIQDARRDAAQQRLWFKRKPAMPVFFRPDPVTGRPKRIPSPIPPP